MLMQSYKNQNICFRSFLGNPFKKKTTTFFNEYILKEYLLKELDYENERNDHYNNICKLWVAH
jgi:hypothetical protein